MTRSRRVTTTPQLLTIVLALAGCGDDDANAELGGTDVGESEGGPGDGDGDPGDGDGDPGDGDGDGDPGDGDGDPGDGDGDGEGQGVGISALYPNDEGIDSHPSVIFHSDFEDGLAGWDSYTQNTDRLNVDEDPGLANGGDRYLRASITRTMLDDQPYLSAQARVTFEPEDELYWRFYARFEGNTAPPHHWVRTIALDDSYSADGHAGYAPAGDDGFWFDFDVLTDDTFKFYTYWHEMRSWMCNDGSTDPGCEGYNGPSDNPHYGNNFNYADQQSFPRDQWFCLELHGKANEIGTYGGQLSFYLNDELAADYQMGTPNGRWLRENFYTHGQYYIDEGPFEGFNFRTSEDVGWRLIVLDAYYQKDTLDQKEDNGYPVQETQTILYDDVVVARERIGCKVTP